MSKKKLLTDKELVEINNYIEALQLDKYYHINLDLLIKLLSSYKHYKELSNKLQTKLDEYK